MESFSLACPTHLTLYTLGFVLVFFCYNFTFVQNNPDAKDTWKNMSDMEKLFSRNILGGGEVGNDILILTLPQKTQHVIRFADREGLGHGYVQGGIAKKSGANELKARGGFRDIKALFISWISTGDALLIDRLKFTLIEIVPQTILRHVRPSIWCGVVLSESTHSHSWYQF